MRKKFLVAVDGSDHGWRALGLAAELAKSADAEIVALHVVAREPKLKGLNHFAKIEGLGADELTARYHLGKEIGDGITAEAESRARAAGLTGVSSRVVEGRPAEEITAQAATERADMLFLGSRGLSDVAGLFMGSVSHKVMHLAPCSCVVVK